jgi:transposase
MTRAYSTDLREPVVAAVRAGSTARAAAGRFGGAVRWGGSVGRFGVAVSSVVKWSQLELRTGAVWFLAARAGTGSRYLRRTMTG